MNTVLLHFIECKSSFFAYDETNYFKLSKFSLLGLFVQVFFKILIALLSASSFNLRGSQCLMVI